MNVSEILAEKPRSTLRKSQMLVVDTGQETFNDVMVAISGMGQFEAQKVTVEELHSSHAAYEPDMVVLDIARVTAGDMEILSTIRANYGDVPVVVVSEALDDLEVRKILKLKVHDWLRKPIVSGDLFLAIQSGIRSAKSNSNRVHAVISTAGGSGATTVAVTLADIFARRLGKAKTGIGLFDLDFSTGGCGALLNMSSGFNLDSVAANPSRVDSEFVNLIQQRHNSGFELYSFRKPEIVTHLNCYELVLRILDVVTMQQSHTILDIPYYETEWRQDVLHAVNTITLVTELNLPSIKLTLELLASLRSLQGEKRAVNVLINKRESSLFGGQRIGKKKLKELFGETPFHYLPADPSSINEAMDRGVVLNEVNSSSKFLKALTKFADTALISSRVAA